MPAPLHIFRDPPLDGSTNMARDEHLLHSDRLRPASVRIYSWEPPTISLGYFQRFAAVAELPAGVRDLPVVRRPTGGGAILHDREVTYCLVVDDSVPVANHSPVALYRVVHACWQAALAYAADSPNPREPGSYACSAPLPVEFAPEHLPMPTPRTGPFFCFERPGRTDLLLGGLKLLGSAQRRVPGRVLQHGSLLLGRRFGAHPGADLGEPPAQAVEGWIEAFLRRLAVELALTPQPANWSVEQLADVERRRAQYADDAWTRRR